MDVDIRWLRTGTEVTDEGDGVHVWSTLPGKVNKGQHART